MSTDCKSVSFDKSCSDSKGKFPHVVSKEELGSGECYWEVMIRDKALKRKSSWSVGVIEKSQSEKKMIRALCYEGDSKVYANTDEFSEIAIDYNMQKLGLLLNCEKNVLSFFNADKTSDSFLCAFRNIPHGTYFALFSPGVKDMNPIRIINKQEHE